MSVDYGQMAQEAAEAHLTACMEALMAEEDGADDPDPWRNVNLAAAFCGCETCCIREILHAAWPVLMLAAREQVGDE